MPLPSWLRPWWPRRRLGHWRVVLYTRRGCHLCEEAWARLEEARHRHGFALAEVDIDTDPDLVRQYGLEVPVVTVNGRVRFRGVVNPVLLRRLFRSGDPEKP